MNKRVVVAVAVLGLSAGAQAAINVSAGSLGPSFINLSQPGNVSGGAVYYSSTSISLPPIIAAIPFQDNVSPTPDIVTDHLKGWIGAGVTPSQLSPAVLSFGSGVTAVSFLWGSPDDYNSFSVKTSAAGSPFALTAGSVAASSGATLGGSQSHAAYVTFKVTDPGETITSISFQSPGINAIEISNVTVVPEPEAYGLALAGMGVVGWAMRRRRSA
jgi:hypothetical protein